MEGDFKVFKNNVNTLIKTLQFFLSELERMNTEHLDGYTNYRIESKDLKGLYKDISDDINHMVDEHVNTLNEVMAVFEGISKGEFEKDIRQLKGDRAYINDTVNKVKSNLKSLTNEISVLINKIEAGDLNYSINESQYIGYWNKIMIDLNKISELYQNPINDAIKALNRLSNGDFNTKITKDYNGELSKLKDNYNDLLEQIPINETLMIMERLATGDLTARMSGHYKGDGLKLKESVNSSIDNIRKLILNLNETIQSVHRGSHQVSSSAHDLSKGHHNKLHH